MSNQATLAILGAGSWGATMAALLHGNGHRPRLWTPVEQERDALLAERHPPGVPELKLPELLVTTDLAEALAGADAAVLVVPAQVAAQVCEKIAAIKGHPSLIVIASKGIDLAGLRPLSGVVEELVPGACAAVLSGPCIAREVARGIPTSVVAACADDGCAARVQQWFASPAFRVYRQSDVLGVEYGGAYKNVIAIAAGVSDGLGFGANSKSAVLTRGLAEMSRFVLALGGNDQTVSGLAGIGDLCVTCFSPYSRNRRFGEALGKGKLAKDAIKEIGETVEGASTAEAVVRIARNKGLQVPVAEAVVHIIAGEWSPGEAVRRLMMRELKEEFQETNFQ